MSMPGLRSSFCDHGTLELNSDSGGKMKTAPGQDCQDQDDTGGVLLRHNRIFDVRFSTFDTDGNAPSRRRPEVHGRRGSKAALGLLLLTDTMNRVA